MSACVRLRQTRTSCNLGSGVQALDHGKLSWQAGGGGARAQCGGKAGTGEGVACGHWPLARTEQWALTTGHIGSQDKGQGREEHSPRFCRPKSTGRRRADNRHMASAREGEWGVLLRGRGEGDVGDDSEVPWVPCQPLSRSGPVLLSLAHRGYTRPHTAVRTRKASPYGPQVSWTGRTRSPERRWCRHRRPTRNRRVPPQHAS